MSSPASIVDRLGFDPESAPCPTCLVDAGKPCMWPPPPRNATEPPDLYHAARIEAAQFNAAMAAQIAGTAQDPAAWKAELNRAALDLI